MLRNTDIKEMQDAVDAMEEMHRPDELKDPEKLRYLLRNAWKMCDHAIKIISAQHRALEGILVMAEVSQAFESEVNDEN